MIRFEATDIPGVYVIEAYHHNDVRGTFVKTLHASTLRKYGLNGDFRESFYSTNVQGVIRGMHFQQPPHDHAKLVYCTRGLLTDVILDLRFGSPAFGKHIQIELSEENCRIVYMPAGVAHGFEVREHNTTMIYLTETEHHPASDAGIRYDTFGCHWQTDKPVISDRDLAFPPFEGFESPFIF